MDILKKIKEVNLREVSRVTGIPYDRMAKWKQGKGTPKVEDAKLLEEYFGTNSNQARPVDPSEGETIITKAGMHFIPNRDGSYTMLTPHVTEYAYAGYRRGFQDRQFIDELPSFPIRVKEVHRGIYRTFTMIGDSMDDGTRGSLMDKDELTGRLIQRHLWERSELHHKDGKFFIIHCSDGLLVKQILEHNVEEGYIVIHSLNEDKFEYPDERIDIKDIKEIYNVVQRSQKML